MRRAAPFLLLVVPLFVVLGSPDRRFALIALGGSIVSVTAGVLLAWAVMGAPRNDRRRGYLAVAGVLSGVLLPFAYELARWAHSPQLGELTGFMALLAVTIAPAVASLVPAQNGHRLDSDTE